MPSPARTWNAPAVAAALAAATVTAQFVAGKATRDAVYLATLDVTTLPSMVAVSALFAIGFVTLASRSLRRRSPGVFVPAAFAVSAGLLLGSWGLLAVAPRSAAVAIYLLVSGVGPMLGSGFWLIVTEGFDPRSAKRHFGRITAAGTAGGLLGGLLAERAASLFGLASALPILAGLQIVSAWQVGVLARRLGVGGRGDSELATEPSRSGFQVLARAPYLRSLALLVLLGSVGAVLVDFVFKAEAVAAFGDGDTLLRFLGVYYGAVSLVTFAVQASSSRPVLEKFGLAPAVAAPSAAVVVGGVGGLLVPGLTATVAARSGESVFRGSLFKAGYELYYTPVSSDEKRAAKSLVDVVFDRLGEATGAAVVWAVLLFGPVLPSVPLFWLAIGCSAAALVVAGRLNRGYIGTLEQNLRRRAADMDLSEIRDMTTRSVIMRTQFSATLLGKAAREDTGPAGVGDGARPAPGDTPPIDDDLRQIQALRSKDPARVRAALGAAGTPPPWVVPHILPLLAWDAVAADAAKALRRDADRHVGALVDALVDADQPFAVRRRLPRVFLACRSQRAVDGLMLGLSDARFEVRFQCARALARLVREDEGLQVERDRVLEAVQRETAVGRLVWESQRLLDGTESRDEESPFLDQFVKDRASRSLAHVFTLLSLVLPPVPLQVAFRGLHTDDHGLRGTALEYLESVLPPPVRTALWPYLEDSRATGQHQRRREDVVADLMQSNQSIILNLEEIRRKAGGQDS